MYITGINLQTGIEVEFDLWDVIETKTKTWILNVNNVVLEVLISSIKIYISEYWTDTNCIFYGTTKNNEQIKFNKWNIHAINEDLWGIDCNGVYKTIMGDSIESVEYDDYLRYMAGGRY